MSFGNLGSFAGGVVQGYQSQQRLNQSQQQLDQEQDDRDRTLKMQEADQQNKQDAIARQATMRQQSADLFKTSYGPQSVQDGEQLIDDGDGRSKTLPIMKTKDVQPGDDPTHDAKVYMSLAKITAENSGLSFEEMGHVAQQVDAVRRTGNSKPIEALLGGDVSQLPAVAKLAGKDPTGATLQVEPINHIYRINYPDGTTSDLSRIAHALATDSVYKSMQDQSADAQGAAKTNAVIGSAASETNLRNAETDKSKKLLRGEIALQSAHADALRASADRSRAGTAALGDSKVGRELAEQVKLVVGPDPLTGQGIDKEQASYLQGRASHLIDQGNGKTNARQATVSANKEWAQITAGAGQWYDGLAKNMTKEQMKAKWGTSDKITLVGMARKLALDKYETAVANKGGNASGGNLANDDSEE